MWYKHKDSQNTTLPETVKNTSGTTINRNPHYRSLTQIHSLSQFFSKIKQDTHPALSSLLSACNRNVFSLHHSIWVSVCWPQQSEWAAAYSNSPNSPTLLVCFFSLKMSHSFKCHPWDSASGRVSDHCRRRLDTDHTETHPCLGAHLLPPPMASAALQQWDAYAVMMNMVLLVNGTQAGTVWRGRDRQLCVSNASSRNWVTLVSHHFGSVRLFHLLS